MKRPRVGTNVLYYMRGNVLGEPLPGIVEAIHAGDGISITTFYKGQATYHQCVLHKDSQRLKESPKLALATGCWGQIPDDEPEVISTSALSTATVSESPPAKTPEPKPQQSLSVAEVVARNKHLKNQQAATAST